MSPSPLLPPLADWRPTRDALHAVAKVLGAVRARYAPKAKHWWHITLHVTSRGLTTTPFRLGGQSVDLELDLVGHQVNASGSGGWSEALPLSGSTSRDVARWLQTTLGARGLHVDEEVLEAKSDDEALAYDPVAGTAYLHSLVLIESVFQAFKGGLRQETSPVQLFPHHFDLAMNWFSGRLVPGKDPADEEAADEQLNFGFVTGDGAIPNAYFYATAYPAPPGWGEFPLEGEAYWHTEGWTGAILPFSAFAAAVDPASALGDFLRSVQARGADLMG